jgi:hypothetical protein
MKRSGGQGEALLALDDELGGGTGRWLEHIAV